MAIQRTEKTNHTEHTIEINNLKKDMETRERHEVRLTKTIENLEVIIDKLNDNYFQVNSSLSHLKDLPDRLRKLEDKSIVYDLIKVGIGIAIYVIISNYASNVNYVKENKIEITK